MTNASLFFLSTRRLHGAEQMFSCVSPSPQGSVTSEQRYSKSSWRNEIYKILSFFKKKNNKTKGKDVWSLGVFSLAVELPG